MNEYRVVRVKYTLVPFRHLQYWGFAGRANTIRSALRVSNQRPPLGRNNNHSNHSFDSPTAQPNLDVSPFRRDALVCQPPMAVGTGVVGISFRDDSFVLVNEPSEIRLFACWAPAQASVMEGALSYWKPEDSTIALVWNIRANDWRPLQTFHSFHGTASGHVTSSPSITASI